MIYQITIADLLNAHDEPIGPGDYVEHLLKPGIPLLVISTPYKTKTGKTGINVQTSDGKLSVYLHNIVRI